MTIATQHPDCSDKKDQAPQAGTPKTRRTPGELENPLVGSNSPTLDRVSGSGRIRVPIKYVRKAQMNQPASAANVPQKSPENCLDDLPRHARRAARTSPSEGG
jgi:hypothetical protein